jgi:DNA repair exonuclease SbcCD ATPase subunit
MNQAVIPSICLVLSLVALIIKWGTSNFKINKLNDIIQQFNFQLTEYNNLLEYKHSEVQTLVNKVTELSTALDYKNIETQTLDYQITELNNAFVDKNVESQTLGEKLVDLSNALELKEQLIDNLSKDHQSQIEKVKQTQTVNEQLTELINHFKDKAVEVELLQTNYAEQALVIQTYKIKYSGIISIEDEIIERGNELEIVKSLYLELNEKYLAALEIYNKLDKTISLYQSEFEIMEYGLYQPQFDYTTSEEFKDKIESNYLKQKSMISNDLAAICPTEWTVNGDKAVGKRMTKLNKKNMLYGFNGECDALIAKVKWNTATRSIERLEKAYESINKLGTVNNITLSFDYYQLKKEELKLVYEFEQKKQEEKEEQRRIREQMREEEKVQREIEKAQREAEEDERRYQRALSRVKEELRYASKEEIEELNEKVNELNQKLREAEEKKQRALSMAQLTKAGHIYIISNIGSFGIDIYKIGMTRRLEPLDRVRELSDASVPFRYDVHAVIYSENAPKLEYDFHRKFDDNRINRVNGRKEFFKVSLEEIENFVKDQTDAEIEFTQLAEAREYRETMLLIDAILKSQDELHTMVKDDKFPSSLL